MPKTTVIQQEAPQMFSYQQDRKAYTSSLQALGSILVFEGGVILVLLLALKMAPWLRLMLLAAYALLLGYMIFGLLLATLRTRHMLDAEHLHLHYGLFQASIPRTLILSVQPTHAQLPLFASLGMRYDGQKQQIQLTFSDQGQLLLHLREPLALQPRRPNALTTSVLFNVDHPEAFLQSFHLEEGTTVPAQVAREMAQNEVTKPRPVDMPSLRSTGGMDQGAAPALHTQGLSRAFGAIQAVSNVTLAIRPGEIYGLLGSNGAGKSTTIKILVGLLTPTQGQALIAGYDIWQEPLAAKSALGYVADHAILYERLSGRAFLRFLAQMRGLPRRQAEQRIDALLRLLQLEAQAERLCGAYSYGMKRKLSLAGALLHQPQVLILDEPLNGLDPRSARRMKDLFLELAAQGMTILLSTHDLATAEEVCHRIGIMHKGRIVAEGSAHELRQLAHAGNLEEVFLTLTAEQKEEVPA